MYVLKISEDSRILSAWVIIDGQSYDNMPIVDTLPDGDVSDYKFIDNEYVYDPLPKPEPEPPEPTTDEVMNVLLGIGGES